MKSQNRKVNLYYMKLTTIINGFRKFLYFQYTKKKARSLGLVGWVENTERGTVVGQVQGPAEQIAAMKDWLRLEGSPESKIEKCVFTKEGVIEKLTHEIFRVVE
ncbi:hypothetical protein ACJMK2_037127 [Sinanodonta woodiana]|uniref:acylphosphatase n=1 Tax=Sinanodonta woodiana TaxID=1069815 RepID=A0ABD3WMW2_SINWO